MPDSKEFTIHKCPCCRNDVHAHLSEGITAVFCQYCKCKVDVGL